MADKEENVGIRYFTCIGCRTEFTIAGCKLEAPECTAVPYQCPWESIDVEWEEVTATEFDEFDSLD